MAIKITILGSAGAFDFGKTSASFLLQFYDKNILIDCGHNVLKKLKDKGFMTLEKNIDAVYITHLHMDHIADLEGLIYYNYFMLNKRIKIYIPNALKEDFQNLFPVNKYTSEYQNGMVSDIECMYNIQSTYNINDSHTSLYLIPFEANHPGIKAYGYKIMVSESYGNKLIGIISGDSKANFNLLNIVKKAIEDFQYNNDPLYIFHDFSEWDDVTRNVHCCNTDFHLVYNELINGENKSKIKFIKYHNGDNEDLEIDLY